MRAVFFRELNAFFSSIVGYVAVLVFLAACGLFLWVLADTSILDYGYASLDRFFELAPWLLMLLIPAVTMRSFADEFRGGTIEWLMTKPVSALKLILGKYFATIALILFALVPTLLYLWTVNQLATVPGSVDLGAAAGSYIGLVFLAAGFAAIGVFCSSLAGNQIVGFLIALFACYLFYTGFQALSRLMTASHGLEYYLSMIGMQFHYNSISRGVVDSRDVIYFLSVVTLFLAATRLSLARRLWQGAAYR